MQDVAAFLGRLAGTALNPIIWLIAVGALAITKDRPGWQRMLAAVIGAILIGAALYSLDGSLTLYEKGRGLFFAAIVAALISGGWLLIRRGR